MPEYKAILQFTSRATIYVQADDEVEATAILREISEADLRAGTQWRDLFNSLSAFSVIDIVEE